MVPRQVTVSHDLKTAGILAGTFGFLAAVTVPILLTAMAAKTPPLPLATPLFALVLALQSFVLYGLLAWTGLRMARARGLDPAPLLTSLWIRRPVGQVWVAAGIAGGTGLVAGLFLVAAVAAIERLAPQTLPPVLHPPSILGALLASATAAVGEELLCRLFLLSVILRILPASRLSTTAAVVISALTFGVLHAPAWVFLFGGLQNIPAVSWAWLLGLNAVVGTACGALFLRYGIGGAILGHFGADLVWHVLSPLA